MLIYLSKGTRIGSTHYLFFLVLQKIGPKPTMHVMEVIDNPKHSLWYFLLLGLECKRLIWLWI
ncbi:hypothetical protein H5410_028761 [Solanum commersonii]|uniref:Uncharacterized protein n=1 Tax=Solanum commersonii TaxID=4109 RepID=A0A9J5Z4X3_SOLCO|nr:hypothetical protein H5410_028761 [Solanum commersonii]